VKVQRLSMTILDTSADHKTVPSAISFVTNKTWSLQKRHLQLAMRLMRQRQLKSCYDFPHNAELDIL
jgi:hypothetical protein